MTVASSEQILHKVQGKPILVANRGIAARRICRTICESFQAIPVVIATDVDKIAPANASAEEVILLGSDPKAYLDIDTIIAKAKQRGAIAIHPGWGFASEDSTFSQKCAAENIIFIGPSEKAMVTLGNKISLRNLAKKLNIPIVPGSNEAINIQQAQNIAKDLSFPIVLKAEQGAGGRGICIVEKEEDLEYAFNKASAMAQAAFGNEKMYIEAYIKPVRHIEIQVIADNYGNIFAFDERDCSIQRKHQKLIEITPCTWKGMTPTLRNCLKDYACQLIKATGYTSLATVEFLVSENGTPYLIEVNTRLQVEHGITECRYGIDLVEEQISIAFGGTLWTKKSPPQPTHTAMQVRINCEDPKNDFTPNSGTITRYVPPDGPGIRIDSNLCAGYTFPFHYDSAGALLISYSHSYEKTVSIMKRALNEYIISGIKTTIPFFKQILQHPSFINSETTTTFIQENQKLTEYVALETESERLAKLMAEISAKGYNPYIKLGTYRTQSTPRVPQYKLVCPHIQPCTTMLQHYPAGNSKELLEMLRDSKAVHITDTTTRDNTQSDSSNRLRLAEDALIGPYLDNCGFFSIENGGGAHFHVAMLANKTYPFKEAKEWNIFAPKTRKQALVRSTNLVGYKPQPKNIMHLTGELICSHYHVVRCFDFLNHVENMKPFAEVALHTKTTVFEPAIALSWTNKFTTNHYIHIIKNILTMVGTILKVGEQEASTYIILGLKDMAGVCPPRFIKELVTAIHKCWPKLLLHYHRHYTDGLFIPSIGAAVQAGVKIIDTALDAAVRNYGQGPVLSTAAYIEDEIGLKVHIDKDMIRNANFVYKQIAPYYDRYCSPCVQGVDYDVIHHGMPGGATSSSQEGALQQGYIHLIPHILSFLTETRKIICYHDVTPGSQITWNTAFLAITNKYKQGGYEAIYHLLDTMRIVASTHESKLSSEIKKARLMIYQDSNDSFRDLLLGKFGKLPFGFPDDWVYESAFGTNWKQAIKNRKESSPLDDLLPIDINKTRQKLCMNIGRNPTEEEVAMYLSHPNDAVATIQFHEQFGDPNNIPLSVWFEGAQEDVCIDFFDSQKKPHQFKILNISKPNSIGVASVRYTLDSEIFTHEVQVNEKTVNTDTTIMADRSNPFQIAAPVNGDLWATYVHLGDSVTKGTELCNINIMKQEKALTSPVEGIVKKITKTANYTADKKMIPVREGELLIEIEPNPTRCKNKKCNAFLALDGITFCPYCGSKM